MFKIPLFHALEHLITGLIPDGLIENLDFDWTAVTSSIHGATQAAQFDHAIAHHAAPEERIGNRHDPIVNMETPDSFSGSSDLRFHIRVPPDVIRIDHHADLFGWMQFGLPDYLYNQAGVVCIVVLVLSGLGMVKVLSGFWAPEENSRV